LQWQTKTEFENNYTEYVWKERTDVLREDDKYKTTDMITPVWFLTTWITQVTVPFIKIVVDTMAGVRIIW
jgi:hypothetical protein